MKIAVVGCGAVGSFYGAKLARAGQEVHFLLRSDYEVVRRKGLHIRSPQGDFHLRPQCAREPEEIGPSDLVIIALKTTANDQFARLLPPLAGPGTAWLTLQNGLGNEEQLARLFPAEQILGGLCFVCLNRLEPGLVYHIDHGQVVLGEFQRGPQPRTQELAALFSQASVSCALTDNLARAHWEKLTWNIPFNGLGVAAAAGLEALLGHPAPGVAAASASPASQESARERLASVQSSRFKVQGPRFSPPLVPSPASSTFNLQPRTTLTTDKLLANAQWARLLRELMLEVAAAARALGFDVPDSLADTQIERTRTMGAYKASTLLDFERGQPLELESLFLEPLRQAQRAGVATPRLAALCAVLQALDRTAHQCQ